MSTNLACLPVDQETGCPLSEAELQRLSPRRFDVCVVLRSGQREVLLIDAPDSGAALAQVAEQLETRCVPVVFVSIKDISGRPE